MIHDLKLFCQLLTCTGLVFAGNSFARESAQAGELGSIARELDHIALQKKQVLDQFQLESKSCWKTFAVNDCLDTARSQKYKQLAPLHQLEVNLNVRQRALKELDRRERLDDKNKAAP